MVFPSCAFLNVVDEPYSDFNVIIMKRLFADQHFWMHFKNCSCSCQSIMNWILGVLLCIYLIIWSETQQNGSYQIVYFHFNITGPWSRNPWFKDPECKDVMLPFLPTFFMCFSKRFCRSVSFSALNCCSTARRIYSSSNIRIRWNEAIMKSKEHKQLA